MRMSKYLERRRSKFSNETMHRYIRAHLILKGVTLADVAKEAGISRQLVSNVARGETRNENVIKVFMKHGIPEALLDTI